MDLLAFPGLGLRTPGFCWLRVGRAPHCLIGKGASVGIGQLVGEMRGPGDW